MIYLPKEKDIFQIRTKPLYNHPVSLPSVTNAYREKSTELNQHRTTGLFLRGP